MEWDKLKTFYYIAQVGNFSKAAERLEINQSSLSRQIIGLEKMLGSKVFFRTSKGLRLTLQGEILFKSVGRVFEELEVATTMIREEQDSSQGPLRISTTVSLANLLLVYHMPKFLKLYPKIKISIFGNDMVHDFTTREVDVALRPRIHNRPDLIQKFIMSSPLQLYASKEYLKKFGTPQTIEDLDDHQLIAHGKGLTPSLQDVDWHLTIGYPKGRFRTPYFEINSGIGGRIAAELGLGIVTLSADHPLSSKSNLVHVLPQIKGPFWETYYIYPKHLKNSKRVHVFGDYIEAVLHTSRKEAAVIS